MKTATGGFPLGWRRRNFAWEKDVDGVIKWAKDNALEVIDLGRDTDTSAKPFVEAGLRIGTADLAVWEAMISPDAGKRKAAVAKNAEYIKASVKAGANVFFMCMVPEDASRPRKENFGYM